jgi:hypothetical protein
VAEWHTTQSELRGCDKTLGSYPDFHMALGSASMDLAFGYVAREDIASMAGVIATAPIAS